MPFFPPHKSTLHPDMQPGLKPYPDVEEPVTLRIILESPTGRTLEFKADRIVVPRIWQGPIDDIARIPKEHYDETIPGEPAVYFEFVPLSSEPGHSICSIIHQNWTTSQQKRIAEDLPGGDS